MTNNNNNISVHIPCQITGTHINFIPDTKKLHKKKKNTPRTQKAHNIKTLKTQQKKEEKKKSTVPDRFFITLKSIRLRTQLHKLHFYFSLLQTKPKNHHTHKKNNYILFIKEKGSWVSEKTTRQTTVWFVSSHVNKNKNNLTQQSTRACEYRAVLLNKQSNYVWTFTKLFEKAELVLKSIYEGRKVVEEEKGVKVKRRERKRVTKWNELKAVKKKEYLFLFIYV